MTELQQERPSILLDKQQINYENALHPSRSSASRLQAQQQPLLDPAKAAALLERGSQFAQKTMQRPISFVGKIFQGLSENNAGSNQSSRAQSPEYFGSELGQEYEERREEEGETNERTPALPPRPLLNTVIQQRQQFNNNLETLNSMFTNVDNSVCYLILHANHGDLAKSIDQ